ncbi:unnamed protein product [Brassica napus]|uniref:(rape) hypothetical protein n=2 Tax=Brassica TaxID=3705 RepID=A0A816XUT2_BRANA|nr:unnamed protein product [Brassica napus]
MKPMLWLNSAKPNIHSPATDDTGTGAFLGFNAEVIKLTHVLASEAAQIVGIGATAQVDVHLPRSFADIVRNTYTFQLKLKDFNITANHQTFTISRIFHARGTHYNLRCKYCGEVTKPALLPNVSPGSEDIAAITSNVAEHSTAADGAIPGHEAVAKEQVDLEENAIDTIQDFTYLSPPSFNKPVTVAENSPSLISLPSRLQERRHSGPVLSTPSSSSAPKRSRKKKKMLSSPNTTTLLGACPSATKKHPRKKKLQSPQQDIQYNPDTILPVQVEDINVADLERGTNQSDHP